MTELDPNIILRAGQYQGPDFAQTLGQVANLKAQAGQQQLQQMQLSQLTRQNAASDAKTAALRGAVGADGQIDYGKIKSAYVQSGDVEGAMGIDTAQASQQKAQLELQGRKFDRGLQLIGGVFDQSSLDRVRAQATAEGLPTESLPEVYDPEKLGQLFKTGLSAKERIDAELAASKFGFEKGKDSRDFNYRASNDAASRAVTMRGQNMTDARGRESAAARGATVAPTGKLGRIPAASASGIIENANNIRKIDSALAALEGHDGSVGFGTGAMGDQFTNFRDPGGVNARASIGEIGAVKVHDLSGAAVSASEAPRFKPFVPTVTDSPATIRVKLSKFRQLLAQDLEQQKQFYGPENGYLPVKGVNVGGPATPAKKGGVPSDIAAILAKHGPK